MRPLRILIVPLLGCVACVTAGPPTPEPSVRSAGASGARSRIANDTDWAGTSVGRVEELFIGRFAGVQVLSTPSGLSIRVRGASTFRGTNEPLFVIDGMPLEPGMGGLVGLNPLDIARIEVLKDAGSLAEYGVRSANGVILITTKKNR